MSVTVDSYCPKHGTQLVRSNSYPIHYAKAWCPDCIDRCNECGASSRVRPLHDFLGRDRCCTPCAANRLGA